MSNPCRALVDRKELRKALSLIRPAASPHVRLEGHKNRLRLATANDECWLETDAAGEVSNDFRLCTPVVPLAVKVNKVPAWIDRVELELEGETLRVDGHTFLTYPLDRFPTRPKTPDLIDTLDLVAPLRSVLYATTTDETRHHLNGVYLERGSLTATDGHRLAHARIPELALPCPQTLPALWCRALLRAAPDKVALQSGAFGSLLTAVCGALRLTAQGLGGEFPPYRNVMPDRGAARARVEFTRGELTDAIRHARQVVGEDPNYRIELVAGPAFLITVHAGDASYPVHATVTGRRSALHVNAHYLLEALEALPGPALTLYIPDNSKRLPIEIVSADENTSAVIMPLMR